MTGYYVVELTAFAFATKEEAHAYHDALIEALSAMPESEDISTSSRVKFEEYTE